VSVKLEQRLRLEMQMRGRVLQALNQSLLWQIQRQSHISLDSTAATTGIAKVDLSAVTGGTNIIDVSEYTSLATTLIGSATGTNSICGRFR
jgi:hypothetical protein